MQFSFFDEDKRFEKLSKLGDVLVQLNSIVDWKTWLSHNDSKKKSCLFLPNNRSYFLRIPSFIEQRVFHHQLDSWETAHSSRNLCLPYGITTLENLSSDS